MRWLAGLSIFQTVVLCYLLVSTIQINQELSALESVNAAAVNPGIERQAGSRQHPPAISEAQLRSIVRTELSAISAQLTSARTDTSMTPEAATTRETVAEPAHAQSVQLELDHLVDTGQVNQRQLDRIQYRIAQLDPATRTAMFQALMQSINSGHVRLTIN